MHRLIILTGPSGVGKTPLYKALRRFYPAMVAGWRQVVLYNSRVARPGETDGEDYHFRPRREIEKLRSRPDMEVMEVRGDMQAIDLGELGRLLADGDVCYEGNPFVARELLKCPLPPDAGRLSIFLSPLSREEIVFLKGLDQHVDLPALVTEMMRRKLLRRMTQQKGVLGLADLQEAERRATSAYEELRLAHRFDWVVPNHDGEDSENWNAFYYPLGEARRTMLTTVSLLDGGQAPAAERWPTALLG